MADRYYIKNGVVEPKTMMSVQDLLDHCKMHGIPRDAILIFRENRKVPQTERNVVDVLQVQALGGITYVILGGYE